MRQGVSARSEPAAAQEGAQSAVEVAAEEQQGAEEAGVCLPREELRAPQPG